MIGGGDTGSDCIGTSARQGAASVTQLEIMPKPPEQENKALTWPDWPLKLRTSPAQEEGCERDWAVLTKRAVGETARVDSARVRARRVGQGRGRPHGDAGGAGQRVRAQGRPGAAGDGLPRPAQAGHARAGAASRSTRAAMCGQHRRTTAPRCDKVFAAGDMRRGQSLVVWAIREGRQCARAVDEFLMGTSTLPR